MTGQACQKEGLKARQIALLQIKNHGSVSADDVVLIAKRSEPTNTEANGRWHVVGASNAPVAYADLGNIVDSWSDTEIAIGTLMGSDAPSDQAKTVEVVLASVSGTTDLYGPILVPRRLTWTDPIKKERRALDLGLWYFRTALLGAEISSLSSACK
jgi:hypothetical protein